MSTNNPRIITAQNKPTVESLITKDLGYCCLFAFFYLYRRTGLISARLGFAPRTIREYRARWRAGLYECNHCSNCMKGQLRYLRNRP